MKKSGRKNKKDGKLSAYIKQCCKNYLYVLILGTIFLTWLSSSTTETEYPDPGPQFYVEDYSGVLTEETENTLLQGALALNKATKAQVVVVTVPNTGSESLETYSYHLAKKWQIGDAELDNGILLLFTTDEKNKHVRLEVGKGLGGCLPDGKSGRILDDYAVADRDAGNWNKAALNTWAAVATEIYKEYKQEPATALAQITSVNEQVSGATMADGVLPAPKEVDNPDPLWLQILTALALTIMITILPFLFLAWALYGDSSSHNNHHDDNDHWYSDYSSGDSGYSGGGGDFDGGGASR